MTTDGSGGNLQSSSTPEWSDKEAEQPFNYWELSEDKTGFPARWKPTGYSKSTIDDHFARHGQGVGAKDKADYEKKAAEFLMSPRGKHGDAFVSADGKIGRYDYDTKVIAIAYSNGKIGTYWNLRDTKSDSGADAYWRGQK